MADLLVIVPTRGRPEQARDLIAAFRATEATAGLVFAVDDDDPCLPAYRQIGRDGASLQYGPRQGLTGWTNQIAVARAADYRALASMGDDHRPRTVGWDAALLRALGKTGGTGIAYGDDWLQGQRIPTAAVISSDIVTALGWMCLPALKHFYVDDVWKLLAASAGCLHYVPEVVIEHLHPLATGETPDQTYRDAEPSFQADRLAFREWRNSGAGTAAIETVRHLVRVAADA